MDQYHSKPDSNETTNGDISSTPSGNSTPPAKPEPAMLKKKPKVVDYIKIPNAPYLYRYGDSGNYYAIKKVNTIRHEETLGTTDRKLADRRLREWVGQLELINHELEKSTVRTVKEKLIANNRGKSADSQYIVRSVIDDFEKAVGWATQVRNIRTSQIEAWLAGEERRVANTTYNRYAGVIKEFFTIAVNDRVIVESPFKRVKTKWKKPQTPRRNVPTVEEFEAIVASIRSQPFTRYAEKTAGFIEFIGLAGLGQAEVSSLTWGDVDWTKGVIKIRRHKTDKYFEVPIYVFLRPLLERLKSEAGKKATDKTPIFQIQDGKKALTNACKRLGLPHFSQRNLRQCLIRRLWKAKVDYKLIAKWQGHQDGGKLLLDTYTEVFGSDDDDYEQQQLAKLGAATGSPAKQTQDSAASPQTHRAPNSREPISLKFSFMENPYKPNEKVMTKIKGADIEATVAQVFKNEVQIKTGDGKLLWRTMHTVWFPGQNSIPKPDKSNPELSAPVMGDGAVAESSSEVETVIVTEPSPADAEAAAIASESTPIETSSAAEVRAASDELPASIEPQPPVEQPHSKGKGRNHRKNRR